MLRRRDAHLRRGARAMRRGLSAGRDCVQGQLRVLHAGQYIGSRDLRVRPALPTRTIAVRRRVLSCRRGVRRSYNPRRPCHMLSEGKVVRVRVPGQSFPPGFQVLRARNVCGPADTRSARARFAVAVDLRAATGPRSAVPVLQGLNARNVLIPARSASRRTSRRRFAAGIAGSSFWEALIRGDLARAATTSFPTLWEPCESSRDLLYPPMPRRWQPERRKTTCESEDLRSQSPSQ